MAAFAGLLLCQLPGLRALGLTALIGLALALVGSLVVMPALLGRR
jgi:predicted RND superfamily exporter protein